MKKTEIQKIVDEARKRGFDVSIRDVAYSLMRVRFKDMLTPYTIVKGVPEKNNDVTDYDSLESVQYLVRWFENDLAPKEEKKSNAEIVKALTQNKKKDVAEDGSMTFEENREGIEQQLREIVDLKTDAMNEVPRDVKTLALLQKTEADLRVKLNDKFGASEKSQESFILPTTRFDMVCPWTRHECYQMTKERAMEKWNLKEQ